MLLTTNDCFVFDAKNTILIEDLCKITPVMIILMSLLLWEGGSLFGFEKKDDQNVLLHQPFVRAEETAKQYFGSCEC